VTNHTRIVPGRRNPSVSDAVPDDDREALPEPRSSLGIVYAQYQHALARATTSDPADRAGAFAEARRLLQVAIALRGLVSPQDPDVVAPAPAKPQERPCADRDVRHDIL
jgi:hypothetical protein